MKKYRKGEQRRKEETVKREEIKIKCLSHGKNITHKFDGSSRTHTTLEVGRIPGFPSFGRFEVQGSNPLCILSF